MNGTYAGKLVSRTATKTPQSGTVAHVPSWVLGQGVLGSTGTTYRFEFNSDPTILARIWDGTNTSFSVDTSGVLFAGAVGTTGLVIYTSSALTTKAGQWDLAGSLQTIGDVQIKGAITDANPKTLIGATGMSIGAGGGSAVDTNIYRGSADHLVTDDALAVAGVLSTADSFNMSTRGSAPSVSAGGLTLYVLNDGAAHPQLRVRNSAGTSVALTAFVDGA